MFDATRTAFLPELLLEITRAKNCRKHSYRKKIRNLEPACVEQNTIRALLKRIRPNKMKPIEDPHYGVDYEYNGVTIDQKFSFGALGENTIKIRVERRGELMNNSNWTMIINSKWETELFETKKLAGFVKRNWGLVQKRLIEKKETYSAYAIKLEEFYTIEGITPIKAELKQEDLILALEEITTLQIEEIIEIPTERIDHLHKICYGGLAINFPSINSQAIQ